MRDDSPRRATVPSYSVDLVHDLAQTAKGLLRIDAAPESNEYRLGTRDRTLLVVEHGRREVTRGQERAGTHFETLGDRCQRRSADDRQGCRLRLSVGERHRVTHALMKC